MPCETRRILLLSTVLLIALWFSACAGGGKYFGLTEPPKENVLRYITGPEPETLDPQKTSGQAEARIELALFDGLVEYDPRTAEPIPAIAERWELSADGREYTFHLRAGVRFSNGDPVTAEDFAYSIRRGLSPELASPTASFGYYIKNGEAYNTKKVGAEELGVTVVDPQTLKITLAQPTPYFIGMLANQFFRAVHGPTVEKFGKAWTRPENIVTSGAFKVLEHRPYDKLVLGKNPNYWDAEMVKLDRIEFYPSDEATTMMNLYKANEVYAVLNHTPPAAWNQMVRQYRDEYLNFPELTIEFYIFNVTKAPMDDVKVRQAFALALDREALAKFSRTKQPLVDFTPEGIFPKYEAARQRVYKDELAKQGTTIDEWRARKFDPEKARRLLAEAGFPVNSDGGTFSCPSFPADKIELFYNTAEANKAIAEFMQAQWKQNLGITVPLKNQETKTFLSSRNKLDYAGLARGGWAGDYMDPVAFLELFYTSANKSDSGWSDPEFDRLLKDADLETDETARFEKLARAELLVMQAQPVLPMQTAATNWMKKPFVKGMYPNPATLHPWKFVYIERDPAKWDRDVDGIMNAPDDFVDSNLRRLTATRK